MSCRCIFTSNWDFSVIQEFCGHIKEHFTTEIPESIGNKTLQSSPSGPYYCRQLLCKSAVQVRESS